MLGCLFRVLGIAAVIAAIIVLFDFDYRDGEVSVRRRFGGETAAAVKGPAKPAEKRGAEAETHEAYPDESRKQIEALIQEETK